jgi:hypothetical protein
MWIPQGNSLPKSKLTYEFGKREKPDGLSHRAVDADLPVILVPDGTESRFKFDRATRRGFL